jgi:hypothetical protein
MPTNIIIIIYFTKRCQIFKRVLVREEFFLTRYSDRQACSYIAHIELDALLIVTGSAEV